MAISELHLLFQRGLHRRVDADEFCELLKQFLTTRQYSSKTIVSAWANCSIAFCLEGDPLLSQYLHALIHHGFAQTSEFITALFLQWNNLRDKPFTKAVTDLNIIATNAALDDSEARKCIELTSKWLAALATTTNQSLGEAVGFLLNTFLNHPIANKTTQTVQHALDQCMTAFPNVSMQLMAKLSTVPKSTITDPAPHLMSMAAFDFEANIQDTPVVAMRSATAVYLNQLLRTGVTIDDSTVISFLNTRYQGNQATIFNDLVFASIDAMVKFKSDEIYDTQCRIFILNKLPAILAFIVTSAFESFSSESSIVDGWNYLIASSTDANIGKKLLHVCTLYHLLSNDTATSLVGESTLKGLYAKDDLVNQVIENHARGPRLIEELLKNDGNAGSMSQAIVEIMHNYCHMKETQHLKEMADAIIRKPSAINSIALFVKPAFFLQPFCALLDYWKWDEIHGESQPVYDEFGSVLLLISAFRQRLRLPDADLGIPRNGFLSKYVVAGHAEQELSTLSETSQNHLGDWIKSLYIDEGLSDELTTKCSAQDFYLLVPTLLRQSILAHSLGRLNDETLKAGLEYLLEPFLLPSLLSALRWTAEITDREPKSALTMMQTLTKQPGNRDACETHSTILAMVTDSFEDRRVSQNPLFAPIITTMNSTRFSIDTMIQESDFNTWMATEGGVKFLLTQMIANQAETAFNPIILAGAIQIHGPKGVVNTLLNLILHLSGSQDFNGLLDFVATVIVINDPALRRAVQITHSNVGIYLKKSENLFAEAVIHLARRVELYATALAAQDLGMDHTFASMAGLNVTNVNLDTNIVPAFEQSSQTQNEDIDQVLNEAAAMGGIDRVDNNVLDEMYGLSGNDLGLGTLDDLDLDLEMF